MCVYSVHQVVACSRGEVCAATVSVTDEVEEWKERNMFAWGAAKLGSVGPKGACSCIDRGYYDIYIPA